MGNKIKTCSKTSFETLCMLDSSDITDEHRHQMVQGIKATSAENVIITHGTNTMTQTAEYLKEALVDEGKTIVLTGSMIPLKEFVMSDAGFNLGYALAQAQSLLAGVYICMHGETFEAGKVTKNFTEARFEEL